MNAICPVCNGFAALLAACPTCEREAEDGGRLNDYYGPYSAYRPIDDVRLTNGFPDVAARQCLHRMYCAACDAAFVLAVPETVEY